MGACLTLMNPTPTPNTRSSELPLASGSVVQDLHVQVAVLGGGPAGLMAAQTLSQQGRSVHLFDGMPSVGRKFLLAGRGGLNLTHSEPLATFVTRFGAHQAQMQSLLTQWGPQDLRAWAADLGIETFVGSSGRVFPQEMKAAPLLRAWLHRLRHPDRRQQVLLCQSWKSNFRRLRLTARHCHPAPHYHHYQLRRHHHQSRHFRQNHL